MAFSEIISTPKILNPGRPEEDNLMKSKIGIKTPKQEIRVLQEAGSRFVRLLVDKE